MTPKNSAQQNPQKKTIGFIVNPVAGMGGAVGLKGTDGKVILEKARLLGAKPLASVRAKVFLSELKAAHNRIRLLVGAGAMGEEEALNCGFSCEVIGTRKTETTPDDTKDIAGKMVEAKVDLLVFCGGDGTARNVFEAVNTTVPCLGVPTGVKMHSAVFAVDPKAAAQIAIHFLTDKLPLREVEVMDVDEEAFRAGRVSAELYGYLLAPFEPFLIQEAKMASPLTESELRNQAAIAVFVIELMKPDVVYVVGPGTTTRTIADLLDVKKTLLGVDIFLDKKIVASDVGERQILEATRGKKAAVIVTPIGGQGFVFGRGNQQISAKVLRQVGLGNVMVVATRSKLDSLRNLKVDTGDSELDSMFKAQGFDVVVDYKILRKMLVE